MYMYIISGLLSILYSYMGCLLTGFLGGAREEISPPPKGFIYGQGGQNGTLFKCGGARDFE